MFHSNHQSKIANFSHAVYLTPPLKGIGYIGTRGQKLDGQKSFKIGLAVLTQYRYVTASQPSFDSKYHASKRRVGKNLCLTKSDSPLQLQQNKTWLYIYKETWKWSRSLISCWICCLCAAFSLSRSCLACSSWVLACCTSSVWSSSRSWNCVSCSLSSITCNHRTATVVDPTIQLPSFDLHRRQWSLLNRLRTGQGHCNACHKKWSFTDNELCDCGEIRTMSHIINSCPLTKFDGGLLR